MAKAKGGLYQVMIHDGTQKVGRPKGADSKALARVIADLNGAPYTLVPVERNRRGFRKPRTNSGGILTARVCTG